MADNADQAQLAHRPFGLFNSQLAKARLNQGQTNGKDAGKIAAGTGDDLVLAADIRDAAGDRAADGRGHGDRGVDVGLGEAREAHGGVLPNRRHAVNGAADVVVAVDIGTHSKLRQVDGAARLGGTARRLDDAESVIGSRAGDRRRIPCG